MDKLLGLLAFLLYAFNLGAADLVTDEAKDAMNIGYPHPPLVRMLMKFSAEAFGHSEFGARLPSAILAAIGVYVFFKLLQLLFKDKGIATIGTIILMLLPPYLFYARTAYLSAPLAAFWIIALHGMLKAESGDRKGFWIAALGILLALFTQLQAILILPAFAWFLWRNRTKPGARPATIIIGLGLLALTLYVLKNRATLDDIGAVMDASPFKNAAAEGRSFAAFWAQSVVKWMAGGLAAVAAAWYVAYRRRDTYASFLLYPLLLSLPVALMIFVRPAPYYAPYVVVACLPAALYLLFLPPWRIARLIGIAIIIAQLIHLPNSYAVPETQTFFHQHQDELNGFVAGEEAVVVVGSYGYQADWYVPVPVESFAAGQMDPYRKFIVFNPESLTPEHQAFLGMMPMVKSIGGVRFYERTGP